MRARPFVPVTLLVVLASCAAVLGLPDPELDETIPPGGGSSGASSGGSSGAGGGDGSLDEDGSAPGDGSTDAGSLDAASDGNAPLACTASTKWDQITPVGGVNSAQAEANPTLTADELAIAFTRTDAAQGTPGTLWLARRATASAPFGSPVAVSSFNGAVFNAPCFSPDGGLLLGTIGDLSRGDIYAAANVDGGYVNPIRQTGLEGKSRALCRSLVADGTIMYLHQETGPTMTGSTAALYWAGRASAQHTWKTTQPLLELNDGGAYVVAPVVREDELEIFYARRDGNITRMYTARRPRRSDPFGPPTLVSDLNTSSYDVPGWLSRDGCRLYFASTRSGGAGGADLYVAVRNPAP